MYSEEELQGYELQFQTHFFKTDSVLGAALESEIESYSKDKEVKFSGSTQKILNNSLVSSEKAKKIQIPEKPLCPSSEDALLLELEQFSSSTPSSLKLEEKKNVPQPSPTLMEMPSLEEEKSLEKAGEKADKEDRTRVFKAEDFHKEFMASSSEATKELLLRELESFSKQVKHYFQNYKETITFDEIKTQYNPLMESQKLASPVVLDDGLSPDFAFLQHQVLGELSKFSGVLGDQFQILKLKSRMKLSETVFNPLMISQKKTDPLPLAEKRRSLTSAEEQLLQEIEDFSKKIKIQFQQKSFIQMQRWMLSEMEHFSCKLQYLFTDFFLKNLGNTLASPEEETLLEDGIEQLKKRSPLLPPSSP
jgi:hypothetical protein